MKSKIAKKISTLVFGLLTLTMFGVMNSNAAPGDLDPTFGNGGIVTQQGPWMGKATAVQSDGKIVVAGEAYIGAVFHFGVARFNTDGSLDNSFGNSGTVLIAIDIGYDLVSAIAIQADGKIVVAGSSSNFTMRHIAVVRYHPDGSMDNSFGTAGIVTTTVGDLSHAFSVAIQSDGKILAAGGRTLVRYTPNGSLDTSFSGTGIVTTSTENSSIRSIAIQADGRIVAAGSFSEGITLARYHPNGSLDTSFNGTGIVTTPVGFASLETPSLAIQSDGRIVIAGSAGNFSNADFAVFRYEPNGAPDPLFGVAGRMIISFGSEHDYATSVAIQPDGKIVAVGNSTGTSSNVVVVRLNPVGALDTTFNGTGKKTIDFGNEERAEAVSLQADGKIVIAGTIYNDAITSELVLIRCLGGSNANIRTRFDFDGDGRSDVSVFRPSDRVWYLNRSAAGFTATQFGLSTDKITPADYDGDGKTDIAVFRSGVWYWLNSSNDAFNAIQFGLAADLPVPADFTGDGRAELTVYRVGVWWWLDLSNNQVGSVQFGIATDKPIVADYDGDGRADLAVYRDGVWHLNRSSLGYTAVQFGLSTDKPVPADYDGDGKTDVAVYRDGTWYLQQSSNGFTAFNFGLSSDLPVPADYDGDGKTDAAVYRDGTWYLRQTTGGMTAVQFGLSGDRSIPSAFLP